MISSTEAQQLRKELTSVEALFGDFTPGQAREHTASATISASSSSSSSKSQSSKSSHGFLGKVLHKRVRPNAEGQQALVQELQRRVGGTSGALHRQLQQGGETDGLSDAACLRWLQACRFDCSKAEHYLREHAQWRAATTPSGRLKPAQVSQGLAAKEAYLQGFDKHKRPLLVELVRNHFSHEHTVESSTAFTVYVLDVCCTAADVAGTQGGKIAVLIDLTGTSRKNMDVAGVKAALHVLQNHFPERLGVCYVYNAPTFFKAIWELLLPFIHKDTRQKIHFLKSDKAHPTLVDSIPLDILPHDFGGFADLIPMEHAEEHFLQ